MLLQAAVVVQLLLEPLRRRSVRGEIREMAALLCSRCYGLLEVVSSRESRSRLHSEMLEPLLCRCLESHHYPGKSLAILRLSHLSRDCEEDEEPQSERLMSLDSGIGTDSPPLTPSSEPPDNVFEERRFGTDEESGIAPPAVITPATDAAAATHHIMERVAGRLKPPQLDNSHLEDGLKLRHRLSPSEAAAHLIVPSPSSSSQTSRTVPPSPSLSERLKMRRHQRPSVTSAMPAMEDEEGRLRDLGQNDPDGSREERRMRFHLRVWKWLRSKASSVGRASSPSTLTQAMEVKKDTHSAEGLRCNGRRRPSSVSPTSVLLFFRPRRRSSCQSVETHIRQRFRVHHPPNDIGIKPQQQHILQQAVTGNTHLMTIGGSSYGGATSTAGRGSWADISVSSDRRPSSSRCLVPPSTTLISSSREMSLESGYNSHSSPLSTPSTPRCSGGSSRWPKRSIRNVQPANRLKANKSVSVDATSASSPPCGVRSRAKTFMNWRSEDNNSIDVAESSNGSQDEQAKTSGEAPPNRFSHSAKIKRKQFRQMSSVFHEVIEDDAVNCIEESPSCSLKGSKDIPCAEAKAETSSVSIQKQSSSDSNSTNAQLRLFGEWQIAPEEVTFCNKIVDGGSFGHDVFTGRWHGDVIIHRFDCDRGSEALRHAQTLVHVRHENIVLFMGASLERSQAMLDIVTNPVKADSLYVRLKKPDASIVGVESTVSIAKQLSNALGYLHAKDIVHGRISSKNVFLERKVQLSLLDYAVSCPNTIYSSPQILGKCSSPEEPDAEACTVFRGEEPADDVFAFGTLLFELFSTKLPLQGDPESVIAAKIRAGSLPRSLQGLACTDRLKRLIQRCWDYEAARRPSFAQMVPHFAPGSCLLRRHSTSEPQLDQIASVSAPVAESRNQQAGISATVCSTVIVTKT